jgi:hypothetical protein
MLHARQWTAIDSVQAAAAILAILGPASDADHEKP